MTHRAQTFLVAVVLLLVAGCSTHPPGRNFVIWISVDGLRHDYVDRYHPPLLTRLSHEGAYTRQLIPIFPSLTFPSHLAEACGVPVDQHGIPGNAYYDTATQQKYSFPHQAALLKAEPIWITAPRQHVRTVVDDWPVSQQQQDLTGARSDYYNQDFSKDRNDEVRLDQLVALMNKDVSSDGRPLRLIMTYLVRMDEAGHKYGPESEEVRSALLRTDDLLDEFMRSAIAWFEHNASANDDLYVLISTDHGMTDIHTQVNLERLLGPAYSSDLHIVTSGPIGNIYLNDVPAEQRGAQCDAIVSRLREHPELLDAYARQDLPPRWHYNDPTRTGDVVVSLTDGCTFSSLRAAAATRPVEPNASKGMHGFDIADVPDMAGYAIVWRYRHKLGGRDLGTVDSMRLHPTAAKLLGIEPAAGAREAPIDLSGEGGTTPRSGSTPSSHS
jgi:predicted AlkP superfamily pyrophosphatase or phosphodiesterase